MGIDELYNQSVTVQTFSETRDSLGERVKTWTTFLSGYKCTIQQTSGVETLANNMMAYRTIYRMYGAAEAITNEMRILDGSTVYSITQVYKPRNHHIQIDLQLESVNDIG